MKTWIIFILIFATYQVSFSQKIIQGKVISGQDQTPLFGVNVEIVGKKQSQFTDINGNYTIELTDSDQKIRFSLIAYEVQEIEILTENIINVSLSPRFSQLVLDEKLLEKRKRSQVVSVGYGTANKGDLMSSIASVYQEDISAQPVLNVAQAMSGRAAGVWILPNSGTPGGGISARIRGVNSIGSGCEPLYVLDGIPLNNYNNYGMGSALSFNQGTDLFNAINPNDIASVDVLKDAAAATIYGSRGANGVILINTHRGKAQRTSIRLSSYIGVQNVSKKLPLMNTDQYVNVLQSFFKNINQNPPRPDLFDKTVNTDWQSVFFRPATIQNHEISMTGGNEKTRFYTSLAYFKQDGIIYGSGTDRLSLRLNLDHQVSNRLRVGASVMGSYNRQDMIIEDGTVGNTNMQRIFTRPNIAAYNADGSLYDDPRSGDNPLYLLKNIKNNNQLLNLNANLFAEIEIANGLLWRSSLMTSLINFSESHYFPVYRQNTGTAIVRNLQDYMWGIDNTLSYNKLIEGAVAKHQINALVGYGLQSTTTDRLTGTASGFGIAGINTLGAASTKTDISTFAGAWALQSYFSRLNYSLNDKYFVSLNFRVDGSSRFAANKKYGYFPSFAAGWKISKENFMQKITYIDNLKIRGSWGLTGNQEIGNYTSLALYSGGASYLSQSGYAPVNPANPNLSWETTEQVNIGLDLEMFNNRISFTADFYIKNTRDLLVSLSLPTTSGYSSFIQNGGGIQNKGIELALETQNILSKNFKWTSNFNIAFNQNKVTSIGADIVSNASILRENYSVSSFFGWKTLGIDPQTGNRLYEDRDGKPTTASNDLDKQIIGNAIPQWIGGFSNNFAYKNFDFSVYTQFTYGNQVLNLLKLRAYGNSFPNNSGFSEMANAWQNVGDQTNIPRLDTNLGGTFGNTRYSTTFVENGSFLRIQNLTLGYNLPEKLGKKFALQNLRLYLTAYNLYNFTAYSGYDPEVNSFATNQSSAANFASQGTGSNPTSTGNISMGADNGAYPKARTYLIGLQIGF